MPIPTDEASLTALFSELGARNPEAWARSEASEGIPQLHRFLFLRNAWDAIPKEGDRAWIDAAVRDSARTPDAPYAALGSILAKCRAHGVSDQELTELARCLQAQMLFSIGYLLDAGPESTNPALQDVQWRLFPVDEDERPSGPPITGLHESVLEFDPSGRELAPP